MNHLTQAENNRLRQLVRTAVGRGGYSTLNDLGVKAGIGSTTLYPFMKKKTGLSRKSADALYLLLEKPSEDEPRKANGHTHGRSASNGHLSEAQVALTRNVVQQLFEVYETTTDPATLRRIDELIGSWAVQGLAILASASRT